MKIHLFSAFKKYHKWTFWKNLSPLQTALPVAPAQTGARPEAQLQYAWHTNAVWNFFQTALRYFLRAMGFETSFFSDGLRLYASFHAYARCQKHGVRTYGAERSANVAGVGTISFAQAKRNRTHDTQMPSETSFSDGIALLSPDNGFLKLFFRRPCACPFRL